MKTIATYKTRKGTIVLEDRNSEKHRYSVAVVYSEGEGERVFGSRFSDIEEATMCFSDHILRNALNAEGAEAEGAKESK